MRNYLEGSKKRICIEHHCAAPSHLILFVLCEGTVIPAFEMQELRLQEAKKCIQVDIISKWRSHLASGCYLPHIKALSTPTLPLKIEEMRMHKFSEGPKKKKKTEAESRVVVFNATVISGIRTDNTLLGLAIRKTLVTLGKGIPVK